MAVSENGEQTNLWIFELLKGEELDVKELQVVHLVFVELQHALVGLDHLE